MSAILLKGVVVDVLNSTSTLSITNNSLSDNKKLTASDAMKNFPRNTAIVKEISQGMAKTSGTEVVCYPFFSSHLCMPLKPGEYVWFMYEDPERKGTIAYWLSRVCEPNHVEDVNYTFAARSYSQRPEKEAKSLSSKFDGEEAEDGELQTFSWTSPTSDPQELTSLINLARDVHRFEPVPRYTKRPGDMVLQGSNNTLIMLGEERGHWAPNQHLITSANFPADGIRESEDDLGRPAIDIVVGRGLKGDESSGSRGNFGATKGKALKNEFGINETDKREKSDIEGDAHFRVDATRIYLTSNSSNVNSSYHPDKLLGIVLPENPLQLEPIGRDPGAFAVIKSDNLRFVAREKGSIRIIKEPTDGKNDGAAIMMFKDGMLQLAGKKLILSSYLTDLPDQPYIRHTALKSLLTSLMDDINTFCTTLATHVTPGFGAPSPQITAAAAALQASIINKRLNLTLGNVITPGGSESFASTIIFGE